MSIEQLFADQKSGRLLAERRALPFADHDAHYLTTEMIEPLVGAVITGGVVIGDGDEEPLVRYGATLARVAVLHHDHVRSAQRAHHRRHQEQ